MSKQVEEVEALRQAAGLKIAAAEKFILDSKSDTKKKISLERSISKSNKDNLKSKMSVLKTSFPLLQESNDKGKIIIVERHTRETKNKVLHQAVVLEKLEAGALKETEDKGVCCNKAHAVMLKKEADESNLRIVVYLYGCIEEARTLIDYPYYKPRKSLHIIE
jgi:hypothetical protein